MTREEIMAMNPGRDLDIKVATELMGYIWITHRLRFSAELVVKWISTPQELENMKMIFTQTDQSGYDDLKLRENYDEMVPNFSTDLIAAEKVVEKLKEDGYQYNMEESLQAGQSEFRAIFSKEQKTVEMIAASAPEAIVKAALLVSNN